jgi:hypothetical protein
MGVDAVDEIELSRLHAKPREVVAPQILAQSDEGANRIEGTTKLLREKIKQALAGICIRLSQNSVQMPGTGRSRAVSADAAGPFRIRIPRSETQE